MLFENKDFYRIRRPLKKFWIDNEKIIIFCSINCVYFFFFLTVFLPAFLTAFFTGFLADFFFAAAIRLLPPFNCLKDIHFRNH